MWFGDDGGGEREIEILILVAIADTGEIGVAFSCTDSIWLLALRTTTRFHRFHLYHCSHLPTTSLPLHISLLHVSPILFLLMAQVTTDPIFLTPFSFTSSKLPLSLWTLVEFTLYTLSLLSLPTTKGISDGSTGGGGYDHSQSGMSDET